MRTLGIILTLSLVCAPLHAQPKMRQVSSTATQHQAYVFDDDLMQGQSAFPSGQTLRVRRNAGSSLLIRPRSEFLQELRKSVENI